MRRAAVLLVAVSNLAAAQTVPSAATTGRALGPETVAVGGARYHLRGLLVPGSLERCGARACAEAATTALAELLAGRGVSCTQDRRLGHGSYEGRCRRDDGLDLALPLLEAGLLRPQPNAQPDYRAAAQRARPTLP